MNETLCGATLRGVEAHLVLVEVDLMRRLPGVSIVGLAASAVRESVERVRSAIGASSMTFPRRRVIVNLAPADLKKDGTALDLPIALAILAAQERLAPELCASFLAVGELGLQGQVRSVPGVLAYAELAKTQGKTLLVADTDALLARAVPGVYVTGVRDLRGAFEALIGRPCASFEVPALSPAPAKYTHDLMQVIGQPLAKRALEVCAAGAHHLLMLGAPGTGKSLLTKCLPSIQPPLTVEESLEISRIHGVNGSEALASCRPFRAPHHSISLAGFIGDRHLKPGEACLAHGGVLFLDEAPQFPSHVLDSLRQPLQDGVLQLTRAAGTVIYPSCFTLVMAANPCPCGWFGTSHRCTCSPASRARYLRRISGPLLDRIDVRVWMDPPSVMWEDDKAAPEGSARVRARVERAVFRQRERGQSTRNALTSAESLMKANDDPEVWSVLQRHVVRSALSYRARDSIVRVARTLADLDDRESFSAEHIHQAAELRCSPLER